MSVNWNLFLWVCLSVLSRFLFFFDSRIQEAPIQSWGVFRKNACKASAPRKLSISNSKSHDRRIYKFLRRGGGGLLQPLLTNLSNILISVRKAGLGAILQKMAQNGPFRVIFPTRGGGGEATPTTLPLKPPMKPVTSVCAENFPLRVVQ